MTGKSTKNAITTLRVLSVANLAENSSVDDYSASQDSYVDQTKADYLDGFTGCRGAHESIGEAHQILVQIRRIASEGSELIATTGLTAPKWTDVVGILPDEAQMKLLIERHRIARRQRDPDRLEDKDTQHHIPEAVRREKNSETGALSRT
jgi:hypothetical protein